MIIVISEVNMYMTSLAVQPPIGSKWMVEFFDATYQNKITEMPSVLYPSLIENGIFDLEEGTSYTEIENREDLEELLSGIVI